MPYHYLEDIATADIAFEAWGKTREEMFIAAADAVMNVMVEDLRAIDCREQHAIFFKEETMEMLLFHFLQELVFLKDARQLLLRVKKVNIGKQNGQCSLAAEASGEVLNPARHELNADIKAITLHQFKVEEVQEGWRARVVLDI